MVRAAPCLPAFLPFVTHRADRLFFQLASKSALRAPQQTSSYSESGIRSLGGARANLWKMDQKMEASFHFQLDIG